MSAQDCENLGVYYSHCFDYAKDLYKKFDPAVIGCYLNLIRTAELLRTAVDGRMRVHNLTGPSLGILNLLEVAPNKRLTMNQIGEQMLVSQPNVTGLVDTLEKRGFVERISDLKDRRVRTIRITKQGSKTISKILPEHLRFMHSLFDNFTQKEMSSMTQKLCSIRSSLAKAAVSALIILSVFSVSARAQSSSAPLTLSQCYDMAVRRSETLRANAEGVFQFEQMARKSIGAILPDVHLIYTEQWQDTSGVDASGGGVNSTLTRSERPEVKIQAHQPIFSGFREFHAYSGFKSEEQRQILILKHAYLLLYEDVAGTFYLALQLEKDMENTRNILTLSQQRINDMESRVKLGKSRESELRSARSQLYTLQGEEEVLKGQVAVARESLSFLVGESVGSRVLADDVPASAPESLSLVLEHSRKRKDLQALAQAVESRRQSYKVARGAFSPTVGLLGNYYLKRVGFQEPIDWDLLLTVDLPLFQGGSNVSGMKIAASELSQATLEYQRYKRSVESLVRKAHINLQTVFAQMTAFENAFKEAQASYKLLVNEYQHGLVNNLDVLAALNTLESTKKALDRTQVQLKLNYLALKVASEDLEQAVNAAENYQSLEPLK